MTGHRTDHQFVIYEVLTGKIVDRYRMAAYAKRRTDKYNTAWRIKQEAAIHDVALRIDATPRPLELSQQGRDAHFVDRMAWAQLASQIRGYDFTTLDHYNTVIVHRSWPQRN